MNSNSRLVCVSETRVVTAIIADVKASDPADLRPMVTGKRSPRLTDGIKHPVTVRKIGA